jgi:MFS family permease
MLYPRLPRDIRVLLAARAVNRLGALSVPFLSLELTRELGASLTTVGGLLAAFGAASLVSRVLGGHLADTWGRRNTMVAGLMACAAAQVAIATATSLVAAAISVVALGLAFELYEPPCQALIADRVDARTRPAAFGLLGVSLSIAALGAGLLATVVAPVSLRLLYVVDAATCLAAGIAIRALLATDPRPEPAPRASRSGSSPWRNARLLYLLAANVVFAIGYLQGGVSLAITLQHRGLAAADYGIVLASTAAIGLATQPILRLRRARAGLASDLHIRQMIWGFVLLAAGFAGYGIADTLAGFLGATAVLGVGEVVLAGHILSLVSGLAPPYQRARYLATFGLSWGIAATLGPFPGLWLLAHGGDRCLWYAVAGCCIVVAAALGIGWPRLPMGVVTCETHQNL